MNSYTVLDVLAALTKHLDELTWLLPVDADSFNSSSLSNQVQHASFRLWWDLFWDKGLYSQNSRWMKLLKGYTFTGRGETLQYFPVEVKYTISSFKREDFPHSSVGKESTCNAGDHSWIPGTGWSVREPIGYPLQYSWTSLVTQSVKNLPKMWETWFQSLGQDMYQEKGVATHFSILASWIP